MSRVPLLASASLLALAFPGAVRAEAPPTAVTEVVVTASPITGSPDRFATIVERVNHDQIVQQGGANLVDALSTTPGISSTSFAAGAGRPVIRGQDANRVKILEDGLSSSDVSDIGPDHGVPIDPLAAQRIEVVRGAATLRYGSQAIGGVVNAINNRVPSVLPSRPIAVDASTAYDSVDNGKEGSVLIDGGAGPVALHADAFERESDDYDTPSGKQANSFDRARGYSVGGSVFSAGGSHAGLALVHMDTQYGIPSDTTYIDMRQTKLLTSNSLKLAGPLTRLNLDASYADYQHTENEPDGSIDSTFKNKEYDGRLEAVFGALGPLSGAALGLQYQDRQFSALGDDSAYLFPTHTRSGAGFGFAEMDLGARTRLQGAVRVEQVRISGTPASGAATQLTFTPISGSFGVVFDPTSDIKLGLTLSSAARAPAQTELFARGGHDGPQTFETGDPRLKAERSNSVEGTLRSSVGPVRFEGSAWASFYEDYIYGRLTGRTCDDDGDCVAGGSEELRELNYAQRDARFYGSEGKATMPLFTGSAGTLDLNVQGDYVRATFSGGGGNVPRIPPYRAGGGLSWKADRFDAGFLYLHAGRQDDVGQGDTPTAAYDDLGAHLAWRPLAETPGVEFALVGRNLTNSVQRNAVALNKDLVVLPGRDVRGVLRVAF